MTRNKAHLADYQEFKGGSVAFGGSNGRITSKGKIKTDRLDFEGVYYVEELKHYNLFSVSQMCDKKNKDETTPILKDFIRQAKNQFNHKVKTIRSDNGTKFKNKELIEFCGLKRIKKEYSNARTLQQNGVAERKNMSLIEAARTMLADSFLPTTFWAEAVNTACYVLNRFDGKSDLGFLVGYSLNSKAFKMFHIGYLTNSMNYETVLVENQANKSASPKEANNSACTQANDDQGANLEETNLNEEHFVLPIWSAYSTTVKSSGDKIEKNTSFKTREKPEANDAAESLRKEATHDIQNATTSSTNLINTASTPLSIAGPLRAFNDGELSYPDPSKYALPDDPLMPHLEDIYASPSKGIFTDSFYDDEGVVTDFTNLETIMRVSPNPTTRIHTIHPKTQILRDHKSAVQIRSKVSKNSEAHALGHRQKEGIDYDEVFAPVARIEAIRIFLAFASYMGFIVYQMDVKSAFLYGTINEEVYLSQPHSFVDPKFPNKVYKVVKVLYGLHQAPIAWYATLSTFLEKSRYRRGAIDKTLFIKKDKKDIMLVQVYVDDIIFSSIKKSLCDEFEKLMKNSVKTASTPIETQKSLVKDEEAADVDVYLYRYLKGQPKLGLWYPKVSSFDLEAYSDSDYAGANLDKKSITGEAEYVAATHCCGQVLWIQNQLLD
nr:retrovirus-related Pol polyprotein from transposon TNT 1-94 [Tanacetum cinerariifolium]